MNSGWDPDRSAVGAHSGQGSGVACKVPALGEEPVPMVVAGPHHPRASVGQYLLLGSEECCTKWTSPPGKDLRDGLGDGHVSCAPPPALAGC